MPVEVSDANDLDFWSSSSTLSARHSLDMFLTLVERSIADLDEMLVSFLCHCGTLLARPYVTYVQFQPVSSLLFLLSSDALTMTKALKGRLFRL